MKTYEHITRFGRNCGLALLVPDASHNYGRSTTLTIAFYKRSWFWEMRSLFIFAKHTRARLLDCTTIMSNYLTIQFVVNARASKLQVMLAPPTKDIFLGLRQQVCSLLSQLHGWFLHMCNLTAWWKTQKAPSITLLESQRCSDPTFLDFSARILSKSPFSAAWNRQHGDIQYLIHWSLICEEIS